MGFDISYHPIKESEVKTWYFDVLKDETLLDKLAVEYQLEDFYKEKFKTLISTAKKTEDSEFFDKTHGYYIAIAQGFFREHFYLRGSAFSFLIEQKSEFEEYTKSWNDIIDFDIKNPIQDQIIENYCSGVFIPKEKVIKLLNDYETNTKIKNDLDEFYSDGHISVFLKALRFAKEHNMGILEATEVVTPNPLDLNESGSYSNLYNCDIEGPLLYQKIAFKQIKEAMKNSNEDAKKNKKNKKNF